MRIRSIVTSVILGVGSFAALAGTASAGWDDSGTKAFWNPAPAAAQAPTQERAVTRGVGGDYSATLNDPAYETYRAGHRHRPINGASDR